MDYFEKRQWVRLIICAAAVIAITLLVAGIIGGEPLTYNRTETTLVTEKGFGGDVTMHVSREGNLIRKLVIDTPDETEGLGKKASDEDFISQFIDKEGPFTFGENEIEAISGATVTSNAVLKGLNRLYGQEEKAAEPETATAKDASGDKDSGETASGTENSNYQYKSEQETNFSTIRVYANAADGKITECLIESEEKSAGSDFLTAEIKEEWAKAIVEAGSADTDVITGASKQFSAKAVTDAVNEILAAAGGSAGTGNPDETQVSEPAAEPTPAPTEEPKVEPEAEPTPVPAEEPKAEETAESAKGLYGSFMVIRETNFSTIRVYADTKDGKITSCRIESEEKSAGSDFLTDEIKDEWAKAIVENGTAETDVITGATKQYSAAAVIEAVNEILAQSGAPASAEEVKDEPAEEPKTEKPMEEPKTEEPAEEPAESAKGLYGSFMVKKETDFSVIRVYADTKSGKITSCRIESEEKSAGSDFLTDEIKDEWAKAIVENGTAETDVITGATTKLSSAAVIEAVNEILAQSSAPASTEESAEEPKAEEPAEAGRTLYGSFMVKKETDFSVIRVYADTKGGKITSCRIESEEKSAGSDFLTDEIKDEWAKAIVENGTAETDVITGATTKLSSAAVIEAVNEILAQSGASVMPAEPAEEPKVETEAGITGSEQDTEKQIAADIIRGVAVTMGNNQDNDEVVSYLEQDPYLVNIYEGYGFAKDYGSARGHSYTLEDLSKTGRPHPKANCITCKTDDFTRLVNTEGIEVYSRPFEDVMAQMTAMGISCYTCHGDNMGADGQPTVSHSYVSTALGDAAEEIDPAILVCGQCHIEYYFTPSDSETMMPYHSSAEMVPDAILAYYDNLEMPDGSVGFSDWTQPSTGAKMLKSQHPEMETVLNSSHYAKTGMNCADCHMPTATTDDGTAYKSHYFVSPLQDETLLNNCAKCHGGTDSVISLVQSTQQKVTGRETEVGNKLSALKDTLAAAVIEEKLTGEELDSARKLYREAQWYFDFCYVENSEGAHNSALSLSCLETSEGKITEAMALLTPAE